MKKLFLLLCLTGCGSYESFSPVGPVPTPSPTIESCTVSPVANGQQITCPNGTSGIILNGTNGTNGINAVSVYMIQFCPNSVPSYPSTFPEYGIVVGSTIYAVYSANDGFLTILTPGWYYSNAIGSSCNFLVNANGTLSW